MQANLKQLLHEPKCKIIVYWTLIAHFISLYQLSMLVDSK